MINITEGGFLTNDTFYQGHCHDLLNNETRVIPIKQMRTSLKFQTVRGNAYFFNVYLK